MNEIAKVSSSNIGYGYVAMYHGYVSMKHV